MLLYGQVLDPRRSKLDHMHIYGHTFFDNNSVIFQNSKYPWTQENDSYRTSTTVICSIQFSIFCILDPKRRSHPMITSDALWHTRCRNCVLTIFLTISILLSLIVQFLRKRLLFRKNQNSYNSFKIMQLLQFKL